MDREDVILVVGVILVIAVIGLLLWWVDGGPPPAQHLSTLITHPREGITCVEYYADHQFKTASCFKG